MMLIADRRVDRRQAETAAKQIKATYEVAREGGDRQLAAFFKLS
jgi:hypothetical protein